MRIQCKHCGTTIKVTNTVQITQGIKEAYGNCPNPDCTARSVFSIAFKYDITPPTSEKIAYIQNMLSAMPFAERKEFLRPFSVA